MKYLWGLQLSTQSKCFNFFLFQDSTLRKSGVDFGLKSVIRCTAKKRYRANRTKSFQKFTPPSRRFDEKKSSLLNPFSGKNIEMLSILGAHRKSAFFPPPLGVDGIPKGFPGEILKGAGGGKRNPKVISNLKFRRKGERVKSIVDFFLRFSRLILQTPFRRKDENLWIKF